MRFVLFLLLLARHVPPKEADGVTALHACFSRVFASFEMVHCQHIFDGDESLASKGVLLASSNKIV